MHQVKSMTKNNTCISYNNIQIENKKLEIIQMTMESRMDKYTVIYSCSEIYFGLKINEYASTWMNVRNET
jgi:hypothetical protein